uniref:Uncharacterized protein n=1 Tax=Esox lucius TaxID=8010 RepID=A0AAY5KDS3_ESOLU
MPMLFMYIGKRSGPRTEGHLACRQSLTPLLLLMSQNCLLPILPPRDTLSRGRPSMTVEFGNEIHYKYYVHTHTHLHRTYIEPSTQITIRFYIDHCTFFFPFQKSLK